MATLRTRTTSADRTGVRRSRSLRLAVLGLLLAVCTLTGCAHGFNAQTLQPYQPAEGSNAQSGDVVLRNILLLDNGSGTGTLYATIVNNGTAADTLTAISSASGSASTDSVTGKVSGFSRLSLPVGQAVRLPISSGTPTTVSGVDTGLTVNLTFTFANAAPVTTFVPSLPSNFFDK